MTAEHVEALRRQYPQLYFERDRLLTYSDVPQPPRRRRSAPAVVPPGVESTFTFLVRDADGTPLPGASILVTGHGWPAQTSTGADGRAVITVVGETPESINGVTVRPRSGYWSVHIDRPALSTTRDNLIEPVRLSETFAGFPGRQVFGWGQQAMNLDRLPPTLRGAGSGSRSSTPGPTYGTPTCATASTPVSTSSAASRTAGPSTPPTTAPTARPSYRGPTTAAVSSASPSRPRCTSARSSRAGGSAT